MDRRALRSRATSKPSSMRHEPSSGSAACTSSTGRGWLQYLEELEVMESSKGPAALPTKRPLADPEQSAQGIGDLGRGALRPLVG
jgi:hypothetical protein